MDVKRTRVANMLLLAEEAGSLSALAEKMNSTPNYLYQLKSTVGKRGMGDKTARKMEAAMGKPHGWLDVPQSNAQSCKPETQPHSHEPSEHQLILESIDVETLRQAIEDTEAVTAGGDLTPVQKAKIIANMYLKKFQSQES